VACQHAYTNYFYDGEGNLDRRVGLQQGATERFGYDALGRLTRMSMNSLDSPWEIWDYDALGNLTANTYRGVYHYEDPARPARVAKVTGGTLGTTRTYGYDAVGDQVSRPGGTIVYNELNLPARLLGPAGEHIAEFLYGPGGGRVRKTSKALGVITYIGGLYEQNRRGNTVEHRLIVPEVAVMTYKETSGVLPKQPTLFLHTDRLGSTAAVAADDDAGPGLNAVVKERRSYDAFGLKRHPDWLSDSSAVIPAALITHGYTGHNDDPDLGLIDMKGRVYDPTLARFLTPAPPGLRSERDAAVEPLRLRPQ
jgi:RHS repeat-associated protein